MKAFRSSGFVLALVALFATGVVCFAQDPGSKDREIKKGDPGKGAAKKSTDKGPRKLIWKAFDEKGKVFYQTLTTKTEQKMKVMDMEVKQNQHQTFYVRWTPQGTDNKGNWIVSQRIIGVKMKIDIGGNEVSYDSTSTTEQPDNPMTDFFKALLTLDLKFVIRPRDMKVERIEGNTELIDQLAKTNPQMKPLLMSILSEAALKKMVEPTLFAFPLDDKNEWDRTGDLDLGPIGSYKTRYKFKRGEEKDGKDRIGVTATMTYAPPKAKDKGKLPFTIVSGKLTGKDGSGYALFDVKKGRVDRYDMKMKLDGSLTIDIGGMETTVELHQEQHATVTTSDTDPLVGAKKK